MSVRSLCVYCGSSFGTEPIYRRAAERLGRLMAENGVRLVYGGRRVGLMGTVAHAVLDAGGEATGVIPSFILDHEKKNPGVGELVMGLADKEEAETRAAAAAVADLPELSLTEVVVVDTMHDRKRRMIELSDGFLALPGGLGTLEEALEVITWKKLQLHRKPIVVLNTAGYWEPLRELVNRAVSGGFAHPAVFDLFSLVDTPEEVFKALETQPQASAEVITSHL